MELFDYPKMERAMVAEDIEEAMNQVKLCLEICIRQHHSGRLFLLEHPDTASSWYTKMIQSMISMDGIHRVNFVCLGNDDKRQAWSTNGSKEVNRSANKFRRYRNTVEGSTVQG